MLWTDRFYSGAISGLQIFTDGASAGDFSCIYNQQEFDILGTTAHTCTFHSEGYRWLEPTTDPRAEKLSEVCGEGGVCNFASGAVGQLQGDSPDDGYFYMDLVSAATLGSARAVTVAATRLRAVAANRSRWGSNFPSWGGRSRSSTSPPTVTSPSLVSGSHTPYPPRRFASALHQCLRRASDRRERPGQQPGDDHHPLCRLEARRRNLRLLDR